MERLNQPVIVETNALEPVSTFVAPAGNTIAEILHLAKVPEATWGHVVIVMNGIEVARDQWERVEPRDDDILGIHVIPLGGDGAKGILRLVALVVIAVAAPYLAGAALAGSGLTGTALAVTKGVLAAGISMVGALLVNPIIPPPKPVTPNQSAAGDAYFINSQTNRARLYEVVPVVYGQHKMYGNLASAPDIFSAGTSSLFTALYDWGLGYCDVWDMRAGDTKLSVFPATIRHLKGVPNHYDPDQPELGLEPIDLEMINYPVKTAELNVELNKSGDTASPSTAPNSKSAVVEIAFPSGLVKYDKQGNEQRLGVPFVGMIKGAATNNEWQALPSGTKGYAGDHFQISGGVTSGGNEFPNPNEPASVVIELDKYEVEKGSKVFVRLKFNQPTYFIRPQDDLWFVNASNGQRVPSFDFNENPNPNDYPSDWVLVDRADAPAKGTFVITEGREYGFEFFVTDKKGYYICRTNMEAFKDQPPPDGFPFPAGVVNSKQLLVGDVDAGGDVVEPPISEALYSREEGRETYLLIFETQTNRRGERGLWIEHPDSAQLYYRGNNIPITIQLVDEYKGALKERTEPQEITAGVMLRQSYYALKVVPDEVSSYGIGAGPSKALNRFDFEYNPTDQYVARSHFTISGNKLTPGRVSIVIPFAKEGEYQVKIWRETDHENYQGDDRFVENAAWTKLVSRGYPITEVGERRGILNLAKKHTLSEVQFQASGNVQGNVQQISAMVRAHLRWHDGKKWRQPSNQMRHSGNPAYAVLDLLTGYSVQNSTDIPVDKDFDGGWISDAQIDFRAFKALADHCNERVQYIDKYGTIQERFRYQFASIIGTDQPIIETVNGILSMCRAQLIINQQGQVSVMLDSNKNWDGTLRMPRQLFTSHNSWGFSAERTFVDLPHALNVSFTDPDLGYQQGIYRVFRPGYDDKNSTIFEDINTFGCPNWHQAAQWGMYQLAQGVLRSETFTLSCDVENLVVQRGDIVELQHDAPLIGGRSAIINSFEGNKCIISETFGVVQDAGYTVRTVSGEVYSGTCTVTGDEVLLDSKRVHDIRAGDLIVIGTRDKDGAVTTKYIIRSITPKADLTAELTMALYDEDLYTTDDGGFPSYDPNFGQTDEESGYHKVINLEGFSYLRIKDRYPYTEVNLRWDVEPDNGEVHRYKIEYVKTGSTEKQFVASVSPDKDRADPLGKNQFTFDYINSDDNFGSGVFFVTPLSSLGYYGKSEQIYLAKVNDRSIPNPPEPFYVERLVASDAMRFIWTPSPLDNDLAGYTIYRMPEGSTVFDVGIAEVYQRIDHYKIHSWEDIIVPGVFWIVSVDTSGNESIAVPEGFYWQFIQEICGNPLWLDDKQHCFENNQELVLEATAPEIEYNGKLGRYGFYTYEEETELEQFGNYAIRSFIETSTNLDSIVIADPPWEPMSDIPYMSWQPDGVHYEVYHECSLDEGEWQRFHAEWVRAKNIRYRLVIASYKPDQTLKVQRACIKVHTTKNLVIKD